MQRNVRVAKNPSNLTKFVNVNQRYKKPLKKFELQDNPTDKFLKNQQRQIIVTFILNPNIFNHSQFIGILYLLKASKNKQIELYNKYIIFELKMSDNRLSIKSQEDLTFILQLIRNLKRNKIKNKNVNSPFFEFCYLSYYFEKMIMRSLKYNQNYLNLLNKILRYELLIIFKKNQDFSRRLDTQGAYLILQILMNNQSEQSIIFAKKMIDNIGPFYILLNQVLKYLKFISYQLIIQIKFVFQRYHINL
ncbi:hypothetical protein pb186bvf_003068 [Paramecium bursaria]